MINRLQNGVDRLVALVGEDEAAAFLRAHGFTIGETMDQDPKAPKDETQDARYAAAMARLEAREDPPPPELPPEHELKDVFDRRLLIRQRIEKGRAVGEEWHVYGPDPLRASVLRLADRLAGTGRYTIADPGAPPPPPEEAELRLSIAKELLELVQQSDATELDPRKGLVGVVNVGCKLIMGSDGWLQPIYRGARTFLTQLGEVQKAARQISAQAEAQVKADGGGTA